MPFRIWVLFAAWLVLAAVFSVRARLRLKVQRRSRTSLFGMAIQAVAFTIAWIPHGAAVTEAAPPSGGWALWLGTTVLGVSVWLMSASVRALGRQWSLAAEIQTHHVLITTGPYAHVRHPIYLGTLGMVIGTGLIVTTPIRMALAVLIYLAGTRIRVVEEERLLRDAFGAEYEDYAGRVRF